MHVPSVRTLSASPFAALEPRLTLFAQRLLEAPFRAVGPKTIDRVLNEIVLDSLAPIVLGLLPQSDSGTSPASSAPRPRILDLGCGPGIPLLPLAIARPGIEWSGIDSAQKRIRFIRGLLSEFDLESIVELKEQHVDVYGGRAFHVRRTATPPASIQPWLGRFDMVVARGTAPVVEVIAMGAAFLAPGGSILVYGTAESAEAGVALLERTGWQIRAEAIRYERDDAERVYAILRVVASS